MKYVNLGRSGLKVSRLCLGCMSYGEPERLPQPWSLDEKASRPLIRQALEAGINFFDTANIYSGGSSEEIGVLGIFRPKTTKCSGGPAVCGLQRGITFFEIPIWALFE